MTSTAPRPEPIPRRIQCSASGTTRGPLAAVSLLLLMLLPVVEAGQPPADESHPRPVTAAAMTRAEREAFLLTARIVRTRPAPGGVTDSLHVTLSDGTFTHDAHVQTVDETRREFRGTRRAELGFRDSWQFNLAAYRLSVLLGLDMIPATVERRHQRGSAAFTWWVDDVAMDEGTRVARKIPVPEGTTWHQQMALVRVFDQLIFNTDRNLGNLLITSEWDVWMIDHTRAFRRQRTLRTPVTMTSIDRTLLARLQALDEPTLERELSRWLDGTQIAALLARRDLVVAFFRERPPQVLFDLPHRLVRPE